MIGTPSNRMRSRFFAYAVVAAIAIFGIARPDVRPTGLLRDFNAFYCAGKAIAGHADPYLAEPLGRCEREPKPSPLLTGPRGLAMPAPLPPFALLPFVVLARLPYVSAAIVWCSCIVLSVIAAVIAVRRITGLPLVPIAVAFVLSDGYASLCLGQVAPIAVAALAVGGALLAARRDETAAAVAACAMIEPHIGLPACIAMFALRPRARAVLIGAGFACGFISFALVGPAVTFEYFRAVLPAHALSEVVNEKQLSLTYALHRFGFSDAFAVRSGSYWYAAMVIFGTVIARGIAKRTGNGAAIVAIPPAVALIGGPFVHVIQMPAALPAAFLMYRFADRTTQRTIGLAITALAVPWLQFLNLGTIFVILAPLAVALLTGTLVARSARATAAAATCAMLFLAAVTALVTGGIGDATPALRAAYDPTALAEASWMLYVRTIGTANVAAFDVAKIPTLLSIATLVVIAAYAAFRPMKSAAVRVRAASNLQGAEPPRRIATR